MSYGDNKDYQRLLQQSRECNSKINDPIWPDFDFIRDFMDAHLICKFQDDLIKTELVMMTNSNRGFFSNQGEVTMINEPIWPVFEFV